MMKRYILFFILITDAVVLYLKVSDLSISYAEVSLLEHKGFLQSIITFSLSTFGTNDYALRLPMMLMHLASVILIFKISQKYLKHFRDRIWLVLLFILLPGVISSALIVNYAGLLVFGLLLFVYFYQQEQKYISYILALSYLLINPFFIYLFIALSMKSIKELQWYNAAYYITLLIGSVYKYKIDTFGVPQGHFLDVIGIYSSIFTPIIFIYIFYVLYRTYLSNKKELTYYLATTALLASLLLSFRQKISVEYFAPYLITSLPLVAKIFAHSYRIRLKMFRKKYKFIFAISFLFLLFNALIVLFNKELYLVIENPKKHFAYNMQIAKEIAQKLSYKNISCVNTDNKMQKRLQFYGIKKCKENQLNENISGKNLITVSYKDVLLYSANVTKINKK